MQLIVNFAIKNKSCGSVNTIPLSLYHDGLLINSRQSLTIFSEIPMFKTTDSNGLLFLGCPNCRHSLPMAVYIIVFPSCSFNAICLATNKKCPLWFSDIYHILNYIYSTNSQPSSRMLKYMLLSLPKDVNCTVSHGIPMCRSKVCCSLVLSTFIQFPLYLWKWRKMLEKVYQKNFK